MMIQMPGGIGISLVNSSPEEILYISMRNIEFTYTSNPHGQTVEVNIMGIQVSTERQTHIQYACTTPVLLYGLMK